VTLLGARHVHVPERLCGGLVYTWGAITNVDLFTFTIVRLKTEKITE